MFRDFDLSHESYIFFCGLREKWLYCEYAFVPCSIKNETDLRVKEK